MPSNQPAVDFASLMTRPATQRWLNLDAYGIAFQIAVYQDGSENIIVGGDQSHSDKLQQLGFTEKNGEWTLPIVHLIPREVFHVFPKMVMEREMLASKIYVDRTNLIPPTFEGLKAETLKSAIHERFKSRIEAAASVEETAPSSPRI
jgi:hypothetical protein